jgi:proline iminopeptidase
MERLRHKLGIAQWLVVGGSWGGGLGLAYAAQHPGACLGLVLRAVFLSRPSDLYWFFSEARQFLPDAWTEFAKSLPEHHHDDPCSHICETVLGRDKDAALQMALAWNTWENAMDQRSYPPKPLGSVNTESALALLGKYRVQSHYLLNRCFFPADGLLQHLAGMQHLPVELVHGRLDWICKPEASWTLHQALPHSRLQWVDQAGHGLFEANMAQAFVQAIARRVNTISTGQ